MARDDWAIASQSRDGPAVSLLLVTISTTSAERSTVSRGTRRPLTLAPDAVVADLGVHGVGEVDRRGALDQRDHAALGREDVDLVLAEVELQRLEEGDRVVLLLLDVGEALHPGDLFVRGALLVAPVRGDAELGAPVHLEGADLHLDGLAARSDHRRVQRLVEVELR